MNKIKKTLFSEKPVTLDKNSLIMAIESSCDETACAIVKGGREVIANVVASQIKIHEEYIRENINVKNDYKNKHMRFAYILNSIGDEFLKDMLFQFFVFSFN